MQKDHPTWVLAISDMTAFRDELIENIIGVRPELQPVLLDLSKTSVTSLEESIKEKLPESILNSPDLSALVHIANLEGTLLSEQLSGENHLLPYLADIPETFWSTFPSLQVVIWTDEYFFEQLASQAPALLEKINYHRFYALKKHKDEKTVYHEMHDLVKQLGEKIEPAETGPLHIRVGQILEKAHRSQEATVQFEKALEAANLSEDTKVMADSYVGFGHLLMAEQDNVQALENYEIALEKYNELEVESEATEVHNRIARIVSQAGDNTKAIRHQKIAFATYQNSTDKREAGLNGKRLGYFLERKGDLDAAAETYGQAAEIYASIEDTYEVALCYQQQGSNPPKSISA